MKMVRLIVAILLLTLANSAYSYKPVPEPTLSGLAGVWVGPALEGWEFLRLELAESGTGSLMVQYAPRTPATAYRIGKTIIDGYQVTFIVQPAEAGAERILLKTDAVLPWRLTLHIGGVSGDWNHEAVLFPLEFLTERIDSVNGRGRQISAGKP